MTGSGTFHQSSQIVVHSTMMMMMMVMAESSNPRLNGKVAFGGMSFGDCASQSVTGTLWYRFGKEIPVQVGSGKPIISSAYTVLLT